MESGAAPSGSSKTRNTIYVSNIPAQAKVQQLLDTFVTFGTSPPSLSLSVPSPFLLSSCAHFLCRHHTGRGDGEDGVLRWTQTLTCKGDILDIKLPNDPKGENKGHRGFAFLTYSNAEDAADAIDNYDLNELPGFVGQGKFLKCSIANPDKFGMAEGGKGRDKPSMSPPYTVRLENVN